MSFNTGKIITVPSRVKVGFQKRKDTFTGKLAFITYRDEKGKLRKEASWQDWRDGTEPLDAANSPMMGFVINKGVERSLNSDRSWIRIYHPLGFEFEIDVANLTFLLMNADVSKRDILEKCVLAWQGTSLVLLPENCPEYKNAVKLLEHVEVGEEMTESNAVVGQTIIDQKREKYIYIGQHEWWDWSQEGSAHRILEQKSPWQEHIFYNLKTGDFDIKDMKGLIIDAAPIVDLGDIVQKWEMSIHRQKVIGIEMEPIDLSEDPLCMNRGNAKLGSIYPIIVDGTKIKLLNYQLDPGERKYTQGMGLSLCEVGPQHQFKNLSDKFIIASNPSNYAMMFEQPTRLKKFMIKDKEDLADYFKRLYTDEQVGRPVFIMNDGRRIAIRQFMPIAVRRKKDKIYSYTFK